MTEDFPTLLNRLAWHTSLPPKNTTGLEFMVMVDANSTPPKVQIVDTLEGETREVVSWRQKR